MKKFKWSLQKLLEVTDQREQMQRAKVAELARQITLIDAEILDRKNRVAEILQRLGQLKLQQRLVSHYVYLGSVDRIEESVERLEENRRKLHAERSAQTDELVRIRNYRQMLDRLRDEAWLTHKREADLEELKQLDESAGSAFLRRQQAASTS